MAKINGIMIAKERLNVLEYIAKKGLKGNALLRALMEWSMGSGHAIYENFRNNETECEIATETLRLITGVNVMGTVKEQIDVEGLAKRLNDISFSAVSCKGAFMHDTSKSLAVGRRDRTARMVCINGKAVRR